MALITGDSNCVACELDVNSNPVCTGCAAGAQRAARWRPRASDSQNGCCNWPIPRALVQPELSSRLLPCIAPLISNQLCGSYRLAQAITSRLAFAIHAAKAGEPELFWGGGWVPGILVRRLAGGARRPHAHNTSLPCSRSLACNSDGSMCTSCSPGMLWRRLNLVGDVGSLAAVPSCRARPARSGRSTA